MCQLCHHTHGILSPDRLEIKVAIILVDQTAEACKSNAIQDLSSI